MMTFIVLLNMQMQKMKFRSSILLMKISTYIEFTWRDPPIHLSWKVMLKSKWLSMVLDVNFMTLTNLKLEFSLIFF